MQEDGKGEWGRKPEPRETMRQCEQKSEPVIRGKEEARGGKVDKRKKQWIRTEQGTKEVTPFF